MKASPTELFDVASWFDANTFDAESFDSDHLAERKAEQGVSVSVVLPTFNERRTVGRVIKSVMSLAGELVDEIVVLDGGSSDTTEEVAASSGARVHTAAGAFPELGPALGKGDALWRSLSVTSGDIVVFIDTDIRNPSPTFVTGLLGPLLVRADVELVKAFYERPISLGGTLHPTGGGRVTELLARPLLNAFWPQLAGLVQPLSGEYAGRRSLLESIPFFSGYGVELGMLIDTLALAGPDAIAQTDLRRRVHRNQDLQALSRMAYGVLQSALARIDPALAAVVGPAYQQFLRGDDDAVGLQPAEVRVTERPPLREHRR